MKVILITGASSGIGYDSAIELAKQGYKVYACARRVELMEELKRYNIVPMYLDITNISCIKEVVEEIIRQESKIDVLINNAGYGSFGSIEDVPIEEARNQFEVNIFGLASMTKIILPYMREQKSGHIINMSSMGGKFVTYMGGWYHATKYALEAFSDALRMEVKQFGVKVSIIEPGCIKTEWGHIAANKLIKSSQGGVYEEDGLKTGQSMLKYYESKLSSSPKVISKVVSKAVNSKKPKARYLVGFGAKPLVFLHTVLPARLFDYVIKKVG